MKKMAFIAVLMLAVVMVPVASINGRGFGAGAAQVLPGPMTRRIMDAYKDLMQFDFVAQYLSKLAG